MQPRHTRFAMRPRGRVFISYRREGGAELARNIREALQKRQFEVFMDVEDLRGGPFNKALYAQIDAATDVVAVLTQGSLDRCFDRPLDWMRLELGHALEQGKNVVPVMGRDFRWPDRPLPEDLSSLPQQSGLPSSHDFFEASMDRLAGRLLVGRPQRRVGPKRLALAAGVVLIAAAAAMPGYWWPFRAALDSQTAPAPGAASNPPAQTPPDSSPRPGPGAIPAPNPRLASRPSSPSSGPASTQLTQGSRWNMCGSTTNCDQTFPVTIARRTGDTLTFQMPLGTLDAAASMIEIVSVERRAIRIAQGPAQTAARPAGTVAAAGAVLGSWAWGQDTASFADDGTGVYEREGKACYTFTYTLSGSMLTMTAGGRHACGREIVSRYRISFEGDTMTMTYAKSGFQTVWKRVK